MGNAQSNGDVEASQLVQSLAQLKTHEDLVVTSPTGDHRLRRDARQQVRTHLFGSDETFGHHASQSSLALHATQTSASRVDVTAIVALIEDLKRNASPDDLVALHSAILSATQDTPLASPSADSPASKTSPGPSRVSRRRSFFTPGIATRDKKGQKKEAKKLQTQTWSPDMFGQSPLSKIVRMAPPDIAQMDLARSSTPDLTANYLGGHEIGSLRVTNGAISPEPSIYEQRPLTAESNPSSRNERYYSASEGTGRDSPEKCSEADTASGEDFWRRATLEVSKRPTYKIPELRVEDVEEEMDNSFASSLDSRLSQTSKDAGEAMTSPFLVDFSPLERPVSALKLYTLEASSNPFLVSPEGEESPRTISPIQEIAVEYEDISPMSTQAQLHVLWDGHAGVEDLETPLKCPSRTPPPPPPSGGGHDELSGQLYRSPSLEVLSRPEYQFDEESFDNEARSPLGLSRRDGHHDEEEEHLLCTTVEQPTLRAGTMLSASSSIYSNTPRCTLTDAGRRRSPRPNFDSGYGSQSSLRTERSLGGEKESTVESATLVTSPPEETKVSGALQLSGRYEDVQVDSALDQHPHTDSRVIRPLSDQTYNPQRPVPEKRFSTPDLLIKSSERPTNSSQPALEKGSPSSMLTPKRLQKRRPQSYSHNSAPLLVQASLFEKTAFCDLPRVPSTVVSRHRRRISENPGMDHLEHTFKSVSHSDSRETLVHSKDVPTMSFEFPSPTHSPPRTHERRGRKQSSGAQTLRFFRSRSRKSEDAREFSSAISDDESAPIIGVADFGTVASSLGSSPYDLAMKHGPQRNREGELREPGRVTHPHQLGSGISTKRLGMDDKAAVHLALSKSRDRLENISLDSKPLPPRSAPSAPRPALRNQERRSVMRMRPGEKAEAVLKKPPEPMLSSDILISPVDSKKDVNSDSGTTLYPQGVRPDLSKDRELNSDVERCDSPSSTSPTDWEKSAKTWRMRRQSIGADLGQIPWKSGANASAEPRKRETSETLGHMYPLHLDTASEASTVQLRTSSPTPSVLERAAALEKRLQSPSHSTNSRPSSPVRRSPSPTRQLQSFSNGAIPSAVAMSKFSAAAGAMKASSVARKGRLTLKKGEGRETLQHGQLGLQHEVQRGGEGLTMRNITLLLREEDPQDT